MFKKLLKFFVTTAMCMMLMAGTAFAATYYSSYNTGSLYNQGTSYYYWIGAYNTKTDVSQPWTLNVESITCRGDYGIRFVPVKPDGKGSYVNCTQSGRWRNSTGWGTVAWATGDAELVQYQLGARRDDNSLYGGAFSSTGKWSSDEIKP